LKPPSPSPTSINKVDKVYSSCCIKENSFVFKMALIAVRPREIPIYILFCALFANCKAKTTQGNTDTKPYFERDSHPRGRQ